MTAQEQDSGHDEILARYLEGPKVLETAVDGLSEADLDAAPDAENWSIRQIVHHLADGENLWSICLKMAIGKSTVPFSLQWYWEVSQKEWAERWAYAGRAISPSLELLAATRRHIVQLIQAVPEAWESPLLVQWPQNAQRTMTVGQFIELQVGHLMEHVEEVRRIQQMR